MNLSFGVGGEMFALWLARRSTNQKQVQFLLHQKHVYYFIIWFSHSGPLLSLVRPIMSHAVDTKQPKN